MSKLVSGSLATLPRSLTGPVAVLFTKGDAVLLYDNEKRLALQLDIIAAKPANTLVQASGDLHRLLSTNAALAAAGDTEVVVLNARQITLIGPSEDVDAYHLGKTTVLRNLTSAFAECAGSEDMTETAHLLNDAAVAIAYHLWPKKDTAEMRGARERQGAADAALRMQQVGSRLRQGDAGRTAGELLALAAFRSIAAAKSRMAQVPDSITVTGTIESGSFRTDGDGAVQALVRSELGDFPAFGDSQIARLLHAARDGQKLEFTCRPTRPRRVEIAAIQLPRA
jgi:hypothetical protein